MTNFVIPVPPIVALPVYGTSDLYPVRRVYCIGRNYAAHAIEMGHDPDREPPFFFQKNPNNLDASGEFVYPPITADVHHEVEMAVMLREGGKNISVASARDHIYGYALALDMTRRDLQSQQKAAGRPWEVGKAFEGSAPVGIIHPAETVGHLENGRIEMKLNDEMKQQGDLNQMIWKVPEIIAFLSNYYELAAGDVILSGTPSGVGPVNQGDVMEATIEGLGSMSVSVV